MSLLLAVTAMIALQPKVGNPAPLIGFQTSSAAKERALETEYAAKLNKGEMRSWLKRLSAKPHHLGSPYQRENAEFLRQQYRDWGFDAAIETFEILFPTPKERKLELVSAPSYSAKLSEPPVPQDTTSDQSGRLPTYNAYSPDGDVTAPLVYANYGRPEDYEVLASYGVSVKGAIVITRYGGCFRGVKPKEAALHGAVGCLIYSDPSDDGYGAGDVYPKGGFRNSDGVQRGSILDMMTSPGDPETPGYGATPGAQRLPLNKAQNIAPIPTLPISYGDAMPFLSALDGRVVPGNWRGGLPFAYHFGDGRTSVHLRVSFDWSVVNAYDVIAKLKGTERPDEWVIRGNHYDGWVMGAEDPLSGQVAMLEEAKRLGELAKTGWRPKRTMVYASWDGEEEGLMGSTEWVETHEKELAKKAVLYINTDSNGRGYLNGDGSGELERLFTEVARDVTDPESKKSVLERSRIKAILQDGGDAKVRALAKADLMLGALGSGSDYSSFFQHVGIATLDLGFGGEGGGGSYHSLYDSFDYFTRFIDPNFDYEGALSDVTGRISLRALNADVLPFEYQAFAANLKVNLDEIQNMAKDLQAKANNLASEYRDGSLEALVDPLYPIKPPLSDGRVPSFWFKPLQRAADEVAINAKFASNTLSTATTWPVEAAREVDRACIDVERAALNIDGLPGRPWYRNELSAPGVKTGYEAKTLPAVREALEGKDWKLAASQITVLTDTLDRLSLALKRLGHLQSASKA